MDILHQPVALYTPLANVFMNTKILGSRSRYGLWMKSNGLVKQLVEMDGEKPLAIIFDSDQCPKRTQQPYWLEFLNQETGVQFGTEKFARDYNTLVIYGVIHRLKRGHYQTEYRLICEEPNALPMGSITELHTQHMEADIKANPPFWLWSHKRWKRKRKDFEARETLQVG